MQITKARLCEIPAIMEIYARAQIFMAENGNADQWGTSYPPRALVEDAVRQDKHYICSDGEKIIATFYFAQEDEPTYKNITDGTWLDGEPYAVIHRLASAEEKKGAATFCLRWALERAGNVRIDTHERNSPMLALLAKLGFTRCGIIRIENGDARIAFQKNICGSESADVSVNKSFSVS